MNPSDRHHLTEVYVDAALQRVIQGAQLVVALPPGYGKTYGTIQALKKVHRPLKILWFMPETHDLSLASVTQRQLVDMGVSTTRIHQLALKPQRVQEERLAWPDGLHVKLLAHAYLPLLFGKKVTSSLQPLLQADLLIVDENPFGSLLSLSGTAGDRLPGQRSSALPLRLYLDDLEEAGWLRESATNVEQSLRDQFRGASLIRDDRQRDIAYLTDQALIQALRPFLANAGGATFGRLIAKQWLSSPTRKRSANESEQVYGAVNRFLDAARTNLEALAEGRNTHGVALVQFPDNEEIFVRNSTLATLEFGDRGVLHLDAFPLSMLLGKWLPKAEVLPLPAGLVIPPVQVEALVPEHPHDISMIRRKAVYYAESHARHHAILQYGLKVLGPRVLILAHQRFSQLFQQELARDYAPHTEEARILYWRANLGVNEYAGWDAFVVNESRLPGRMLYLDLNAVTNDMQERRALMAHLEATDFLQLIHRTRPLIHDGRILLAFNPAAAYSSPLIAQTLQVRLVPLPTLRGKSEHVLALQLARTVAEEALATWGGVPMRLFHLLFGLHAHRPPESWDAALFAFLDLLKAKYQMFDWLKYKPSPGDRQDRGLVRLLHQELGLTGYSQPVTVQGRGRPHLAWLWVDLDEADAAQVHSRIKDNIHRWHEQHFLSRTQ